MPLVDDIPRFSFRAAVWLEGFKNLADFNDFIRNEGNGELRIALSISPYAEDHVLQISRVQEEPCAPEKTPSE